MPSETHSCFGVGVFLDFQNLVMLRMTLRVFKPIILEHTGIQSSKELSSQTRFGISLYRVTKPIKT